MVNRNDTKGPLCVAKTANGEPERRKNASLRGRNEGLVSTDFGKLISGRHKNTVGISRWLSATSLFCLRVFARRQIEDFADNQEVSPRGERKGRRQHQGKAQLHKERDSYAREGATATQGEEMERRRQRQGNGSGRERSAAFNLSLRSRRWERSSHRW